MVGESRGVIPHVPNGKCGKPIATEKGGVLGVRKVVNRAPTLLKNGTKKWERNKLRSHNIYKGGRNALPCAPANLFYCFTTFFPFTM